MTLLSTWAGRLIYALTFLLIPITVLFKAAPNLICLGIVICAVFISNTQSLINSIKSIKAVFYPLGLFMLWSIISSLWSINFQVSFITAVKYSLIPISAVFIYTALTGHERENFFKWLTLGYLLGLLLLFIELRSDGFFYSFLHTRTYNPYVYNHSLTILLLLSWPLLSWLVLKNKNGFAFILTPFLAIAFYISGFHASVLAFSLSLLALILCYLLPKFFLRVTAVGSLLIILIFPWAINHYSFEQILSSSQNVLVKLSYHHRIAILKRTADLIAKKPLTGYGVNTYPMMFDQTKLEQADFSLLYNPKENNITDEDLEIFGQATHPHNLTLQVWYETGLFGALFLASFLFSLLWYLSNRKYNRFQLACFAGLYTSSFIIMHVSFSAWQTWWLFILSLSIAVMLNLINSKVEN